MLRNDGPSASAKQMQYLLSLIRGAGHTGFRDARRPLGLTQRQAGGTFTVGEASALIDELLASGISPARDTDAATHTSHQGRRDPDAHPRQPVKVFGRRARDDDQPVRQLPLQTTGRADSRSEGAVGPRLGRADASLADARADVVRGIPADLLAAELARRGWTVTPPPDPF